MRQLFDEFGHGLIAATSRPRVVLADDAPTRQIIEAVQRLARGLDDDAARGAIESIQYFARQTPSPLPLPPLATHSSITIEPTTATAASTLPFPAEPRNRAERREQRERATGWARRKRW